MESNFEIIECAIVAAARNHNPTILNPDFLKRNGIVPEDWEVERPICTDVFSQVAFKNGFIITVETQKIVFAETAPERNMSDPSLDTISTGYIKTLPHATYTAVGINFKGNINAPSPEDAFSFIRKFVSDGPWKEISGGLKSAKVHFQYEIGGGILNLSFEPALFQRAGQTATSPIIGIAANFHRDLTGEHDIIINQMKDYMKNWKKDKTSFINMTEKIFQVKVGG